MIKSCAVIEGAKFLQLFESAYVVKESYNLRQDNIFFIYSQGSGNDCDVLANAVGMGKFEPYVCFNLCIPTVNPACITLKPFAAEKKSILYPYSGSGTSLLESEFQLRAVHMPCP